MDSVTIIVLILIGLPVYFAPSFVATSGKKKNSSAIMVLNFFLGWSLVGWVAALVWAMVADKDPAQ